MSKNTGKYRLKRRDRRKPSHAAGMSRKRFQKLVKTVNRMADGLRKAIEAFQPDVITIEFDRSKLGAMRENTGKYPVESGKDG